MAFYHFFWHATLWIFLSLLSTNYTIALSLFFDYLFFIIFTTYLHDIQGKALQRVMKCAQHIPRTELPSMEDLHPTVQEDANRTIRDPNHNSFIILLLLITTNIFYLIFVILHLYILSFNKISDVFLWLYYIHSILLLFYEMY